MEDNQLIDHMKLLLKREAILDLEMIETLREIHRRKLYMSYGTNGFHKFCEEVLGMSGDSAWRRMHAASLVDRFPDVVKPLIAERKVHLTGLAMLDKVITSENGERLLKEAVGKSKTEIKAMIAREDPKPDCKAGVRKLPAKAAELEQLSEKTWRFQANLDVEGHALFAEVADLLGSDDCNAMLKKALKTLRDELWVTKQKRLKRPVAKQRTAQQPEVELPPNHDVKRPNTQAAKLPPNQDVKLPNAQAVKRPPNHDVELPPTEDSVSAKDDDAPVRRQSGVKRAPVSASVMPTPAPTPTSVDQALTSPDADVVLASHPPHDPKSRDIPRWMERLVRERDGHRCMFVGTGGRCTATRDLQVHHIIAWALGGPTEIVNLALFCGRHNRYQAELDLGVEVANAWRRGRLAR